MCIFIFFFSFAGGRVRKEEFSFGKRCVFDGVWHWADMCMAFVWFSGIKVGYVHFAFFLFCGR